MPSAKQTDDRPNFLVILADGMYTASVVACGLIKRRLGLQRYWMLRKRNPHPSSRHIGQKWREVYRLQVIVAPELKAFTRLTNVDYAAAACSPTRSMLLSGTDNHIAGVGMMSEQKGRVSSRFNVPGYEGFLNHNVAALSEILQDNGYHTLISGKWHLGYTPESNAASRGFDRAFTLLAGQSNHYGWEPLLEEKHRSPFFTRVSPQLYTLGGKKYDVEPNLTNDPKGFYTSDTYTDTLIDWLKERTPEDRAKPFFAYLPFLAPHWPLQCSDADRDRYEGVYDDGPEALRAKRLARMKELGLIDADVTPHDVVSGPTNLEWDAMTPHERKLSARAMQCFAGMVDNLDQNVGRMVQFLKQSGQFENTVIVFQSDNGAEGADIEAQPTMGPDVVRTIRRYYDNSFENIGHANSYVWYGSRWAQASTAPSRLYKAFSTEGGIRVPFGEHHSGSFCFMLTS